MNPRTRLTFSLATKILLLYSLIISVTLILPIANSLPIEPTMMITTSSRVAVVTGANKGIGFHIAERLASSGIFSDVIVGCRSEERGMQAVKEIENSPNNKSKVTCRQLTIGDRSSHVAFVKFMDETYGKVDVLVNNAGMAFKGRDSTPFKDQCKTTLAINFWGTVNFTEEMLPLLRKGTDTRVVSVASMAGYLSQLKSNDLRSKFSSPQLTKDELTSLVKRFEEDVLSGRHLEEGWGNSNYGMSKLALIAMTKVWSRVEAKNGISVNVCCPGYCVTDMTSQRGARSASEGARNAVIPATMDNPPSGEYFADFKVARWGN